MSRIVIALGGNALGDTPAEQRERITDAAVPLVGLIAQGHEIIVSHGNGPQVGAITSAFTVAHRTDPRIPEVDLPECTAMSQGYIGYHLQQGIQAELLAQGMPWHVATVVTQVRVDPQDPAFQDPTKPIGPFLTEDEADQVARANPTWVFREDSGRGWRRVVPSPRPVGIVEHESILNLLDHEFIVIACGGGGVPVVRQGDGTYRGVPAVIDKDFSSAALADAIGANHLFILTAVDKVSIGFGTDHQQDLDRIDAATAQRYADAGEFGAGSMLPKVQAGIDFVRHRPGRRAVICSLEQAPAAMAGSAGTAIVS